MIVHFHKYQGAGNDFIIIDDRQRQFPEHDADLVNLLCDRHFGIGADGLMLYRLDEMADFFMKYYNADGKESSLCGNGSRCIVQYAHANGFIGEVCSFLASDGLHQGWIHKGQVTISMLDTDKPVFHEAGWVVQTGSPHLIRQVEDTGRIQVTQEGRHWRNHPHFAMEGINVNFVEFQPQCLRIRTYERGVEEETLACGTGITGAAILAHWLRHREANFFETPVQAVGGLCHVSFHFDEAQEKYTQIRLSGPALKTFEGTIDVIELLKGKSSRR